MNEELIIQITPPEVSVIKKNNIIINKYNYDDSHLIYKAKDIGSFKEILWLKQENQQLKENNQAMQEEMTITWKKLKQRGKVIDEAIDKIQLLIDIGFDYDGFNQVDSLKTLIDELVRYARESRNILQKCKGDNKWIKK